MRRSYLPLGNPLFRVAVVSAVTLVAGTSAWGVTIRSDTRNAKYLSLGASSEFASVGRFDGATSSQTFVASGTLIGSGWVLTAAHVVDGATSLDFSVGGKTYSADAYAYYPSWTGDLTTGADIALVHLSSNVTNVRAANLYTGRSEAGQTVVTVGYGMTGTGDTGSVTFDGQKRAGTNTIEGLGASHSHASLFYADFDNPKDPSSNLMGSATPTRLESLIAPGDSGGGDFIQTSSGWQVAGVNSFGGSVDGSTNSSYGDYAGFTRVSSFDGWIESLITSYDMRQVGSRRRRSYSYDGAAFDLTMTTVPEPTIAGLAGLASLLLLRRRR